MLKKKILSLTVLNQMHRIKLPIYLYTNRHQPYVYRWQPENVTKAKVRQVNLGNTFGGPQDLLILQKAFTKSFWLPGIFANPW